MGKVKDMQGLNTTYNLSNVSNAIDMECEECNAQPGEPCRPWCIAHSEVMDMVAIAKAHASSLL